MPEIELTAGIIEYADTGGDGPVVVFLHGVAMDETLWRHVVPGLRDHARCIVPTLPLGGHRKPMRPDADLSIRALVALVAELLERLDLRDVTLVGNDWGGAQLLISEGRAERVARLVLCSCEAFDNYPPGLPGKSLALAGRVPGGLYALLGPLRIRALRRLPLAFGWMSKRVPQETLDRWLRPALTQKAIRRDLRKYVTSDLDRPTLLAWAERQRAFTGPVLVVWAAEDRVMPRAHGRRLAELFPHGRLVEIEDSYTLIPEDQPAALTAHLREFLSDEHAVAA